MTIGPSRFAALSLLVAILLLFRPAIARAGDAPGSGSSQDANLVDKTVPQLVERLEELRSKSRVNGDNIEKLGNFQTRISRTLDSLGNNSPSVMVINSSIERLKAALDTLVKDSDRVLTQSGGTPSTTGVGSSAGTLQALNQNDIIVQQHFYAVQSNITNMRNLTSLEYQSGIASFNSLDDSSPAIEEFSRELNSQFVNDWRQLPRSLKFLDSISNPSLSSVTVQDIKTARNSLDGFNPQELLEDRNTAVQNRKATIEKTAAAVQVKIDTLNILKKDLSDQIVALEGEIYRKSAGQQDTSSSVRYMMVLLGLMFLGSVIARLLAAYIHPDSDGRSIIDDRTMIEFGGMSFILLTIVILGNTDKLDRQALGTLLGTIAGYIFGKSFAGLGKQRPNSGPRVPADVSSQLSISGVSIDAGRTKLTVTGAGMSQTAQVDVTVGASKLPSTATPQVFYSEGRLNFARQWVVSLGGALAGNQNVTVTVRNPDGTIATWTGAL